jgi:hypothetical protein
MMVDQRVNLSKSSPISSFSFTLSDWMMSGVLCRHVDVEAQH